MSYAPSGDPPPGTLVAVSPEGAMHLVHAVPAPPRVRWRALAPSVRATHLPRVAVVLAAIAAAALALYVATIALASPRPGGTTLLWTSHTLALACVLLVIAWRAAHE